MDVEAYLERIGYSGSREPVKATLFGMQAAHRMHVPFENLDIHIGRELTIDGERLFDKIVRQRRGGWCHELNGLWSRVLREMGFRVDVIGAAVVNPASPVSAPFGHCTTVVHLDEPWWSDVGFGVRPREPVPLKRGGPQFVDDWEIEFSNEGEEWSMRSMVPGAPQQLGLRFSLQPREYEEFRATQEWQQTSPESLFTQRPVASLFTPEGRASLVGDTVTVIRGQERADFVAANEAELDALLREHFGLELGEHQWRGFPWRRG